MGVLKTTLIWHDSRGGECEEEVRVAYEVSPGYAETRDEPGCDDTVEITAITGMYPDVPAKFYDDDDLKAECLEHWHDHQIAAAEYAAEHRAEMLAEERRMERY